MSRTDGRFVGKVAIVTGAAQGIGEAYARALAAEGAAVVVADLNSDAGPKVVEGIEADGGQAVFSHTDVASPESAQAMAALAVQRFGGIDYLVNNAAIYGSMQLDVLLSVDWDYYKSFMSVNLDGALACGLALLELLRARQGGDQRPDPAARARARLPGHQGQRDRAGTHRHRGDQDRGRRPGQRPGEVGCAAAPGPAVRPGGRLPVPAVRRGRLHHRSGRQRRRRPGLPALSERTCDTVSCCSPATAASARPARRGLPRPPASAVSTSPSTPTSRCGARRCTRAPGPASCPTTGTSAPSTRGWR